MGAQRRVYQYLRGGGLSEIQPRTRALACSQVRNISLLTSRGVKPSDFSE